MVLLRLVDVEEDLVELADRIHVPSQHEVGESIVIDSRDMATNDAGVNTLLSDVDGLQPLETGMVITEEAMNAQKTDHAEVTKDLQHVASTAVIVPISCSELLEPFLLLLKNLDDGGLLHKGLQEVEHAVHIPRLRDSVVSQMKANLYEK